MLSEVDRANALIDETMQSRGVSATEGTEEPPTTPRFELLNRDGLSKLKPPAWRVHGVLPDAGLVALFGSSGSGKSFLALDVGAAIAEDRPWFGHRVKQSPVVYVCLEGEGGLKLRVQAWEAHHGRTQPEDFYVVLQPFKLTDPVDVRDLAAVVPFGSVVFIDTLNRAAPTADENSSRDMGEVLEAAKRLQKLTGGLVVLVHHSGKDATKGLRGHSSVYAAMDAVIEVSRDGDRRRWSVAKSKDGQDGDGRTFKLSVVELGVDVDGDLITSCAVTSETATEEIKQVRMPQGGNQKIAFEALRPFFRNGRLACPGAPPLRPCIELQQAVIEAAGHLTCDADHRIERARVAITGLVARGVFGCNDGWLWIP